ncbi:hypothetical protein DPMN_022632 [Dreissena polymorpha]|uniref:Uncharacterized protein n=1 Tax=Dreissena polymorpha TaxID=45954 RepID=A0A9D4NKP3_DREPO|nr:hypothetical protein DPMN_022632 [Dreissena polymorpha]
MFTCFRLCKEVTLISESRKTNLSDLHELSYKIKTILKELKNLHNTKQTIFQAVEGSYSKRLQEVRDVRQKINSALDKLEMATLKELDDVRTSLQADLKTDVENYNKLMDDLELLSEAVQELADRRIGEMAFIASRKCLDKIKESQVYLKKTSLKFDNSIASKANTDIEQYLNKQFGIGKILHRAVQGNANHPFTVTKKCEYDLKIPTDGRYS